MAALRQDEPGRNETHSPSDPLPRDRAFASLSNIADLKSVADAATEDLDDEFDHIDESHYVDTEDSTKHKKKSPIFRRCGELAVPLTLPLTYDSDPSPSPSSSPDRFPFGRRYDVGFFSLPLIWRPPSIDHSRSGPTPTRSCWPLEEESTEGDNDDGGPADSSGSLQQRQAGWSSASGRGEPRGDLESRCLDSPLGGFVAVEVGLRTRRPVRTPSSPDPGDGVAWHGGQGPLAHASPPAAAALARLLAGGLRGSDPLLPQHPETAAVAFAVSSPVAGGISLIILLYGIFYRPIVLIFLLLVLIVTSQFEWKQHIGEAEANPTATRRRQQALGREDAVKEKVVLL
ncbi:hypothetical protein ZEAMMB73_Zm00001d049527 [Zea mays]|uniref:Uncharacterized protein n=1 Tax=Zea mays TaxID=4577 RepID=A0A1D6PVW0_MAIZE|nr:hypothetical protein ZEAMMB73_Zm00001d049527 [Zea mays]